MSTLPDTPRISRIYLPSGFVLTRDWRARTRPSLEWLQAAVGGGLIEPVDRFCPLNGDRVIVAYANEEGRLRGMHVNPAGSRAVRWPVDAAPIVGPVVVLSGWTGAEILEGTADAITPPDLGTCLPPPRS